MNILSAFAIALGLSMDNFAVTIASGCVGKSQVGWKRIFEVSSCFTIAHIIMFGAGWWGGQELGRFIDVWDHWVACAMLVFIGGKMIWEAWHGHQAWDMENNFSAKLIVGLAVATSLDALGVGVALSLEQAPFWLTLGSMAGFVFFTSCIGFWLGSLLGQRFGKAMEICGGLVLVAIGIKMLLSGLGIW